MLLNSSTGLVILALVLVAGWLLGLASSSGGRKWKERYAAERDAHAAARRDADARVAEADRRHAELEREHARLAPAAPVTAATVAPRTTVAANTARPAYPVGERRGWFEFGDRRAR
jgi:hypothetical protein